MKRVILIVEDEEVNRKIAEGILKKEGYEVLFAENGKRGVEKALGSRVDVILMDAMMPVMDGFEATRILKGHGLTKLIPLVMTTALSDKESAIKAIRYGADDYLVKPYNVEELKSRIRCMIKIREFIERWVESPVTKRQSPE